MSDNSRNFRTTYYGSLGFRENEKTISQLENQLKAEVIDISKLKSFCLKYTLPVYYRPQVWKILLNTESKHINDSETHKFIMSQKRQQFDDLKHAVLLVVGTGLAPPENIVQMYFMQKGISLKRDSILFKDLCIVAKPFLTWYPDEFEAFFTFSKFTEIIDNIKLYEQSLIDELHHYLSQKDNALYNHLTTTLNIFHSLPFKRWHRYCFVLDLPLSEIEVLWDRIIGGSYCILIYVISALLLHKRRHLMSCKDGQSVLKLLQNLTDDDASFILKMALELWEQNGSQCQPLKL